MRKGTYFLLSCLLSLLSCYTEFKKLEYVVLYGDLNASGADNMAGAAVAMVVYPLFAAVFYGIIHVVFYAFSLLKYRDVPVEPLAVLFRKDSRLLNGVRLFGWGLLLYMNTHPEKFGLYTWWMYLVSNLVGLNLLVWIVGIIRERRTERHLRSL
ncbi:hypothetical protein [Paenibacillus sp. UNC499MF]|uniref:hypothetical protein n=1 Tax=Paenibacillus sp. UNC499MF TaxID=1502751 RepID=UPI0008A068ED|nr:hypothetical protein [Paenibacillus sp. UNC499MF]SEF65186.1 hypothetical protein SAMN02799616_00762 [Paenibacillus sp. UNC499MF]